MSVNISECTGCTLRLCVILASFTGTFSRWWETKIWRILYVGYCILIKSGSGKYSCTQVNSCVNFIQCCIWRNSHKIYWGGIILRKGCHKIHPILLKLVFKIPLVFVNNYGVKKKKKALLESDKIWLTERRKNNTCVLEKVMCRKGI